MARKTFQVEIKRIPLEVKLDGLNEEEIRSLSAAVEQYMLALEEEGKIDTFKQALRSALFFAAQEYLLKKNAQEKEKREQQETNKLISRLQQFLEPEKPAAITQPVVDSEND